MKSVVMTNLLGSSRTVVSVLRTKVFAKTILKHYLQTMFKKTVCILRSGFKYSLTQNAPVEELTCPAAGVEWVMMREVNQM